MRLPLYRLLSLSILGMAIVFTLDKPLAVADLAVYLRMGAWMVTEASLYDQEVFLFTATGVPFINGTWLAQILLYGLHQIGGWPLLQLVSALLFGLTLWMVEHHGRRRSGHALGGTLAIALAFILALQNLGLRPQTFSLPLFALSFVVADLYAHRPWAPWVILPLYALWANLHGAFPAGLVILAVLAAGAAIRALSRAKCPQDLFLDGEFTRRALLAGLGIVGTWLTPVGPGIYAYVAYNAWLPSTRHLDEWAPAALFSFMGLRLVLALLMGAVLIYRAWRRGQAPWAGARWESLLLLLAFGWLAVGSQRMILWFGLVCAPLYATWLPRPKAPTPVSKVGRRILAGGLIFWLSLAAAAHPWRDARGAGAVTAQGYPGFSPDLPIQALDILQTTSPGRVFNRLMWGSWLLWAHWPTHPPYIDPRIWIHSQTTWDDYLALSHAKGNWQGHLDNMGVEYLLIDPDSQEKLTVAAEDSPRWRLLHLDDHAALFQRSPSRPSPTEIE